MTPKQMKTRMGQLHKRDGNLAPDIHELAVHVLSHAAEHGDVTLAGRLVEGFTTRVVRDALIAWFKSYSPIIINTTTFQATQAKANMASFKPYDVAGAKANPYYLDSAKDVTAKLVGPSDILGVLYSKLNQLETANKEGRFVGDFNATKSALLRAIQASGVVDIEAVREQTKNLKDAANAAAKKAEAKEAIAVERERAAA